LPTAVFFNKLKVRRSKICDLRAPVLGIIGIYYLSSNKSF